ncbi:MAG: RNA polymerase sigma factor [Nanoarchaeota archaeon]
MLNGPETETLDVADLYRQYRALVQRVHYSLTRNQHTAEDLTQETFVKVIRYIHIYDGRVPFEAWLIRIARNTAIDYFRKKKEYLSGQPQMRTSFSEDAEDYVRGRFEAQTPEDEAVRSETGSRLSSFLADYPNKTVDVLLLNMAGVPEKDISEQLDLTKNAVKIRRHYIRKQIKQYLQDEQ